MDVDATYFKSTHAATSALSLNHILLVASAADRLVARSISHDSAPPEPSGKRPCHPASPSALRYRRGVRTGFKAHAFDLKQPGLLNSAVRANRRRNPANQAGAAGVDHKLQYRHARTRLERCFFGTQSL